MKNKLKRERRKLMEIEKLKRASELDSIINQHLNNLPRLESMVEVAIKFKDLATGSQTWVMDTAICFRILSVAKKEIKEDLERLQKEFAEL